jgi:hypothetical protein
MKKLTAKTWYKIVTDDDNYSYAEIYGILKATGKKSLMGTCHVSCIDVIQATGRLDAENVVIRWKTL